MPTVLLSDERLNLQRQIHNHDPRGSADSDLVGRSAPGTREVQIDHRSCRVFLNVGGLCLVLVQLSSADPALAASDEVLRAVYCAAVLNDTIDQLHHANTDADRETSDPSRSAILEGNARLLQQLAANRDRLESYAATRIDSNDQSDALRLGGAKRRGEADSRQCAAESSPEALQCAFHCSTPTCTGAHANCVDHCYEQCGMPICARTLPCLDPTWLPD